MVCFCRFLRHTLLTYRINGRLNFYPTRPQVVFHYRTLHLPGKKISHEEILFDLRRTLQMWRRRRNSEGFQSFLHNCFQKHELTSFYFIELLRHACEDGSSCSSDLIYNLLLSFRKYIDTNDILFDPSEQQQTEVLNCILGQKNFGIIRMACEVFKISEMHKLFLKEYIENLVQQQKFVEAAYCIGALNFHQEYPVEQIMLPLFIEGKIHIALSCIANSPVTQLEIAEKMDSFLDIGNNTQQTRVSAHARKIFKSLSSLIGTFQIPSEKCKNLHLIRGKGALNVLIKKREKQSITEHTWEEMVLGIIKDDMSLKEHLIYKLAAKKDLQTAQKMLNKLNMHDYDLKTLVAEIEAATSAESVDDSAELDAGISDELEDTIIEKEDINNAFECLSLSLQPSHIKYVDTKGFFVDCIEDITQNYKMVGIDTEWKPHFGLASDRLSLMQIAVHDKVYILDLLSLTNCMGTDLWDKLTDDVFGNPKIIKLGCGIMSDVEMIVGSNKGTNGKTIKFSHILDMAVFYQKLQEVYPEKYGDGELNTGSTKGLSKLCEIILGKPLNKEERLCDWEKRPLKESQLRYAALDAHCLLMMFDKLKKDSVDKGINFNHLANVAVVMTTSLWKPKRRFKGTKNENAFQVQTPLPIQNFKVIVDSNLEFLGKQLRQLGADVVILQSTAIPNHVVQVSKLEGRMIICSDAFYKQLQRNVPQHLCLKLSDEEDMTVAYILQKFNVVLSKKNILSRCTFCNSEDGLHLSAQDFNFLQEQTQDGSTAQENVVENSALQKTVSDMKKSGISITINGQSEAQDMVQDHTFLCMKCGNVQ